ncbi:monovalent cation/H(+) antiporter subunit G [Nonomuraea sp. NPDC049625]|uniref:monovalent cation/H(+) antiporter subunit G n=1 Tax=Nonomuraea sp. NPDC049625 TaxID=3155775 RepID=UPI0034472D55
MSAALIWAGVVVAAFAAIRLLLTSDRFRRLHFVSAGSVPAAPLVITGPALMPWSSWHDIAKLVVMGALLIATGPATVITTAHAARRRPHD